jgi:hemoglobin
MTLYEQLGGIIVIRRVVDEFYDRVLGDESLAPYFVASTMSRQRHRLAAYLADVSGGPPYDGPSIRAAHSGLDISRADLEAVTYHLTAAMEAVGLPPVLRQRVGQAVSRLADDIVGESQPVTSLD